MTAGTSRSPRIAHLAAIRAWCGQAEPYQLPPGGYPGPDRQLMLGGRGSGKTRSAAGWASSMCEVYRHTNGFCVGPTHRDVRYVMFEGDTGLLAHLPDSAIVDYNRADLVVTLYSGVKVYGVAAAAADRARGYEGGWAWFDEIAAFPGAHRPADDWQSPVSIVEAALRGADRPLSRYTTTPRPNRLVKSLHADPTMHTVQVATWDNPHLPDLFIARARSKGGTLAGRQEFGGELVDHIEGAAWTHDLLAACRIDPAGLPALGPVTVTVDPSVTTGGDEAGILAGAKGADGLGYVLADVTVQASPGVWAARAARVALEHDAREVVAETNQGGELVLRELKRALIEADPVRGPRVQVRSAWAGSSRGQAPTSASQPAKWVRALRTAGRYGFLDEDGTLVGGEVRHAGQLRRLEDEQTTFTEESGWSPNRLDALHYLLERLVGHAHGQPGRAVKPSGTIPGVRVR